MSERGYVGAAPLGHQPTPVGVLPEDWSVASVGSLIDGGVLDKPLDGNHGETHPKSADYVYYGIPFVMANNLVNGQVDLDGCKYISEKRAKQLRKGFSIAGDVLLTHKGTIGSTAIVPPLESPYIMLTPQVTYYRIRAPDRLSNEFLRHYFDSAPFQTLFSGLAGGGTRAYLGIVAQHALPVVVPPAREQRAIAAALSDVDALIGALDRLIAKKRDLKQAAMQQLLTGQTRLPGFSGEWETSVVGREFEIQLGKMLDSERNTGTPKPYVGNRAVQWGSIDTAGLDTVPLQRAELERYRLRKGDLLVCEGGEVGRAAIWDDPIDECYYQKALHRLRPLRGYNPRFLLAMLRFWADHDLLANYVTQTSIAHLTREKLAVVPIPVPQPHEQDAIATVLTDIDGDIATMEKRRDKTRQLKQGMMQELLTGRTRLV